MPLVRTLELSPIRRRVARAGLTLATIILILMLSAFPMDVWILAGRRDEQSSFMILAVVAVTSIWAHVAIARGRAYGRELVMALGAYALLMILWRGFDLTRMPGWRDDSTLVASLVISGTMLASLLIAAVAISSIRRNQPD